MERLVKINGYVYSVSGDKGFETFYNMGKDIDDPMWKEETDKMKKKWKKSKK